DIKPALMVPDLEALLLQVIESVQPVEREVRDRDDRWHSLRLYPYRTLDHKIEGAVLVLADIDQIRRDGELLRHQAALIELSQDAVIVRDAENRVTIWNRGAQDMYGWTSDEARGKLLNELLGIGGPVWTEINDALHSLGKWEGEIRVQRRDNGSVTIHNREVLVRGEDGSRAEVLAIQRDVTERKRTLDVLKQADRRKDEFLATLAHELRNPLSPIRNAVEVMRLSSDDPLIQAEARDVLYRQVRQMSRIVEDLIDVSRIVEKKVELRVEAVPMGAVMETAVESCRSAIEAYRHHLHVSLPPRPVTLMGDSVRLSQVVINLLTNAAKYTPPGGDIWLSAEVAKEGELPLPEGIPAGRSTLIVRVRDNGIGIAPEFLPRIFDLFSQAETTSEATRSGLGVGLSLVRSLVEMHGGYVKVKSVGRGTEFTLRLPIVAAPSEVGRRPRTNTPVSDQEIAPRCILLVDDNKDQADSLAMLLRLQGHQVEVAYDGRSGYQKALTMRPDVALLDIGMPELNGYEVARHIREHPELAEMILIAQTGWGQEEDRERSAEAGFDHHLVKPIDMNVLRGLMSKTTAG
ncbi:MAG TPA: ATP-binding protein, partial [Candidatus Eisenbacteria bacterium]